MDYKWRDGFPYRGVDPNIAGQEIKRITTKSGGKVKPETVIMESKKKSAPLHPMFDWNETEAAHNWRKAQARGILGNLVQVEIINNEPEKVRSMVCVAVRDENDESQGKAYMPIQDAMNDPEYRQQVINEARSELEGWQRRFKAYGFLADSVRAVKKIVKKIA